MAQPSRNVVVGVFESPSEAQQAVAELRRLGFPDDQLGVISRTEVVKPDRADEGAVEAMGGGAAAGALAGLGLGFLWALAAIVGAAPGVVFGGGLLIALLGEAGAFAAIGTIVGALVALGVPEPEARWYESEVQAGQVVVTVRSSDRYNEAFAVLRRFGAYDVASGRPTAETATTTPTLSDVGPGHTTLEIPVQGEEVAAGGEGKRA